MLASRLRKIARASGLAAVLGFLGQSASGAEPGARPQESKREQAAAAYDEAVRLSSRAEYEPAARKFLEADAIVPSADALSSAIASARRANAHLLVAEAADRAVGRQATDPELAARAREALAEAELRLSRFRLSCRPAPCELDFDGSRVAPGRRYALPGVHVVRATAPSGAHTDERLTTAAGTEYVVALEVSALPAPLAADEGSTGAANEARAIRTDEARAERRPSSRVRPLDSWVFYAGLGTTAALAGVTTWSGIDTLNAKADLPNPSSEQKNADVSDRAHRTDWLLGGTLVVAAATAAVGLVWVDWGPSEHSALILSPVPGGAVVGLVGAHR
jgi:hypothetical protein